MMNFEKVAAQFESMGEVMSIPGMDEKLKECTEGSEKKSNMQLQGAMMKCIGYALKTDADAVCRLAACDLDISVEDFKKKSESEIIKVISKVFSSALIPFFVSGSGSGSR